MTQLFLCACKKGNKISEETINNWKAILVEKDISYTLIDDLCGIVADNKIDTSNIFKEKNNVVIACQPKAVKNLLAKLDVDTNKGAFKLYNADEADKNILDNTKFDKNDIQHIQYNEEWKPWYPVLDYDLCIDCQRCLNFCLFGVYKLNNEGKVLVENPENCKDLCPACARTCPTNAIVFPKHHEAPIDGGEGEFTDKPEDFLNQIQENQDVYKVLANRRKASGVSLFKTDQLKIAEQERRQCNCKKDDK